MSPPAPSPTPAPVAPRTPHLPVADPPAGGRKGLILLLVAVVVAAAAFQWWRTSQAKPATTVAVQTVRVQTGPLEQTVRLTGQTAPRDFSSVVAPLLRGLDTGPMVIQSMVPTGTRVNKGDVLAQLDPQAVQDHLVEVEEQVITAAANIHKRIANQSMDTAALQQTMKVSKATAEKARLTAITGETKTAIDQELLRIAKEEAEAAHAQSLKDFDFKILSQQADLRMLEIAKIRTDRHLARHKTDLANFTIRAPRDGLAVVQQVIRSGNETQLIKIGDQLGPGQLFLKVVRTDNMQVEATVNQAATSTFRVGQLCRIRLDAYPGLSFKGRLVSLGAMAMSGRRENYFIRTVPLTVAIEGGDERLIPDLSASVDVIIAAEPNVRQVPLAAVRNSGNESFVYLRRGDRFERRSIALGLQSATHAAVVSGLEVGDEIAISGTGYGVRP